MKEDLEARCDGELAKDIDKPGRAISHWRSP